MIFDVSHGVENDWKSLVIKIMSCEMQELEEESKVHVLY